VWLIVLGLAAAATPQALAAEGAVDVALPLVPDATELATAILEEAAVAAPPAAVPEAPPASLPAAPAQTAAVEPVQSGADAAPPPEPVAEPAPAPDPEPQPLPVQPDPPIVQQEPTNVNVSVRIDSPGDDGAVTQVNVVVDDPPAQYQPEEPQYQPVVPPADAPARQALPASPVPDEPPDDPDGSWEWTWNWSCGDAPVGDIAVPFGVGTQDWTWNWNWICGGNETPESNSVDESPAGYQAPITQYRPVNINVSIRIGSPGDNGPVVQANVAVGVTLPSPVLAPVPASPQPPVAAPAPAAAASPAPTLAAISGSPAAPVASPPADEFDDCCLLPEPRGVAFDSAPPVSVVLAARTAAMAPDTTLAERDTVAIAARFELRARREAGVATSPPRPQARPARPAATRSTPQDEGRPIAIQGGLGFAPLNGPDQVWPYVALMLFAFVFASLNVSWASARSRPTPGVDADEPPSPPG
jgi:hypothetical protein